jgi:anti-sigma-K factor RskA
MNCDDVRELLPAYVLGALDAEDLEAVEEHLRAGNEHDEELVELRATVFALDRFAEEPDTALDVAVPIALRAERARRVARPALWQMAAAAAVLIAVFAAGWLASGLIGGDKQDVSILVQAPDGSYVVLESAESDDSVTVTMEGFARLPEGQAYQVWAIREGRWLRIGVCNTDETGWWKGDFAFSVQPAEEIALTVEPTGGSDAPTTEPLLRSSS